MPLIIIKEQVPNEVAIANLSNSHEECISRVQKSQFTPKEGNTDVGMNVPFKLEVAMPFGNHPTWDKPNIKKQYTTEDVTTASKALNECYTLKSSVIAQEQRAEQEAQIQSQIIGSIGFVFVCVLAYTIYRVKFSKKIDEKKELHNALNSSTLDT